MADAPIAAPHSPQNFSLASLMAPHLAHIAARGAPHSPQNLRPCRLSLPHFEQRIIPPLSELLAQLLQQRLGLCEISRIEALGEPVVDLGEHRLRLLATALLFEQPHETRGRSQLP